MYFYTSRPPRNMISKTELRYVLALQRAPYIGDTSAKKLLHYVGSAEGIFKEKRKNLLRIDGIGASKLRELSEQKLLDAADRELAFMETNKIACSYFMDDDYPFRLKHCSDGPILFFHQGAIHWKDKKVLSVVGTRGITSYGRKFCEQLIEELAVVSPVIVSGFAYGVDIVAHATSITHNLQTVAVLAHGFDRLYPEKHRKYKSELMEKGGFITEFWSDNPFDRNNFLKRNRIIAGVSEATVVIESAEKGGSLVTADIANSYNREVFAVPGRTTDLKSRGCNNLIRTQQAHLITAASDIMYLLNWMPEAEDLKPIQKQLFVPLNDDEKKIFRFLEEHKKELLDIIALECDLSVPITASLLLQMELKGVVRPLPGKVFELI